MEKKYRDPSEFRVSSEASGSTLQFSTMGEQEEYLLGMKLKADLEASRSRNGPRCYTSRSSYLIVLLVLLNMMVLLALLLTLVLHMNRIENTSRNPNPWSSWLPPNRLHKKIFNYKPIYPAENAEEAQKARTNLIPVGKGFVVIRNDTVLPEMPQLDQSLPEKHAMVSVFHQLHCLFIAREVYFNPAEVNLNHLYHCWDYLRQGIMCSGDTSLEWVPAPPDEMRILS